MTERSRETSLPIATGAEVRAVLGTAVRHHRGRSVAVAVLFLLASALGLVLPLCLGRIVDAVTTDAGALTIVAWVGGVALGAVSAALVGFWGARVLAALVQDVLAELRESVFASAMRLPVSTVDDGESADLLSRVTGDVDAVAEAGGNVVPTLLSAGFAILVSLVALSALNPWLALAGLACLPFYVIGTRAFLRRSRVVFREMRAREAERSQAVIDAVAGRDTLTALNEQDHALERVEVRAAASIRTQIDGVRVRNRLFRWINGGEAVGLLAILATGFALYTADAISVGMVTTAALVFHRLFNPIGQLIFGLDDIQRAVIGLARLVGVIDLAPAPDREPAGTGGSAVGIALDRVSFGYPTTGRGVTDVSLRVEAGSTVALVGSSGSGKSTLARVIAGHHPPDTGVVRIDRGTVPYYISQELHHFRGSIADNLRLVDPEASDADIAAALRAVGAEWALTEEDRGSEAPLDEGRIQQLAIARALLADAPVVILDEASADVGLQHREVVESAISTLRRERTTVLIAHRLQQASSADQIIVFDDGGIAQRGTHSELQAAAGIYRDFWEAQSRASPTVTHTPSDVDDPIHNTIHPTLDPETESP